jgi:glycogen synthase
MTVHFANQDVVVQLWQCAVDGIRWILFEAPGYFEAAGGPQGNNPYDYSTATRADGLSPLCVDSLFAAAAVPRVLAAVGRTAGVVVHPQDWQFVATALTVKQALLDGLLDSAAVVLTSHNPYDCELPEEALALLTPRAADRYWPRLRQVRPAPLRPAVPLHRRQSFYECMLPLLDAPVSTVSRTFACELTTDPLQTVHFADHLQENLKKQGVVGVNNGLFLPPKAPFANEVVAAARQGQADAILARKSALRQTMLQRWTEKPPGGAIGGLDDGQGGPLLQLPETVPVFMMFGRLDPGQKGFDVLVRAIEALEPGAAKFVLAADAGGGVEAFVEDFRRLAAARPGDVVCFTERMERLYLETMAGSSFCVMPSMYEPFGGATEPYLQGTPVVARATGGLVQQVVDLDQDPAHATGLLYRESYREPTEQELGLRWRELLDCTDPQARQENPLYGALIESLREALRRARHVYRREPHRYAQLLAGLYDQAMRFSWTKAAEEYTLLYDLASAD